MYDWGEIFYYDETSESGLRWKIDRFGLKHKKRKLISMGDMAGAKHYRNKTGDPKSWQVGYNGKLYNVHRIIWEIFHGPIEEGRVIDHTDRNPFNNKISNLRVVCISKNNRNMPKNSRNKSGVTGVIEIKNNCTHYFRVFWREDGKQKSKNFNIKKFGKEEAFNLAVEYREAVIKDLNLKGYEYHESHGK